MAAVVAALAAGGVSAAAAAGAAAQAAPGAIRVPDWAWEPHPDQVTQHCLRVPTPSGVWYNESVRWANDSRLLSIAVPEGPPPPTGWPVMIDLLVIDWPGPRGQPTCGLDGARNPQTTRFPPSTACAAAANRTCGNATHTFAACRTCYSRNRLALKAACQPHEFAALEFECPQPPPLAPSCAAALATRCNYTLAEQDVHWERNCSLCVSHHQRNLSADAALRCPTNSTPSGAGAVRRQMTVAFCGAHAKQKGQPGAHLRGFPPFASPQALGEQCSCINGSKFACDPPWDDEQHGVSRECTHFGDALIGS